MKNVFKKMLAVILAIILLLSFNVSVTAVSYTPSANDAKSIEDILTDYHLQLFLLDKNTITRNATRSTQGEASIKLQTIEGLTNAGYEAYDINEDTYAETETALKINFDSMGLDPMGSYVMVVHGEEVESGNKNRAGGETNPVSYTASDGVTYSIKFVTVTGDENSNFLKANTVDLLTSSDQEKIYACLDTAVGIIVSEISPVLGTVLSLMNLGIEDFLPDKKATLQLHCGTAWTRVYTLVWSDYFNEWLIGSCVEYATATSFATGLYYCSDTNQFEQIPGNSKSVTEYSEKCFNFNWRKEQAVIGANDLYIYYDLVGDVKYTYDGRVVCKHYENF